MKMMWSVARGFGRLRAMRLHCHAMSRRTFVKATVAAAAVNVLDVSAASGVSWPIGCFNRPWMQKFGSPRQPTSVRQPANWELDVALAGIKEAGYTFMGLLTPMPGELFLAADADADYLPSLKKRIAESGVTATMGALRLNFEISQEEMV